MNVKVLSLNFLNIFMLKMLMYMLYFQKRKIEADSYSDGGENHTCQE